jgi:hypothetical protein
MVSGRVSVHLSTYTGALVRDPYPKIESVRAREMSEAPLLYR